MESSEKTLVWLVIVVRAQAVVLTMSFRTPAFFAGPPNAVTRSRRKSHYIVA